MAQTAEFQSNLAKAEGSLGSFGKSAGDAGSAMDSSMGSSAGAVRLLTHELGVPLPRELSRLVASLPMVGAAFETMLPIIGVVAAIAVVEKFISKANEAQRALEDGFSKSLAETSTRSDELKVSIAETQAKIDKLLGKPISGDLLAVEVAKARVEADKLAASLEKDLDELVKLMDKSAHGSIMTAIMGTSGSGQAEDVAKGLRDALAQIPKDAKNYNDLAAQATVDAWQRAQSEITKNNKTAKEQNESLNMESGGHVTDFGPANKALQEFQEKLSSVHDNLSLLGKEDSLKKVEAGLEGAKRASDEAAKALKKEQEAGEKMFNEIQHKRIEYEDAVLEMSKKEAEEAEKLFTEIERRNETSLNNRLEQEKEEAKEAEKLFKEIEERNRESADNRIAQEERLLKARQKSEKQGADYAKMFADETLFHHKSAAEAIERVGQQMLQQTIAHILEGLMVEKTANAVSRLDHAKTWASGAGSAVAGIPFIGPILAPIAAAAGFAAAMAFANGGLVPGTGSGDTVPSMLQPGETVVSRALTEQVRNNTTNNRATHVHPTFAPTIHAMDAEGVDRVLEKHSAKFEKHFQGVVRKMNR